jgi:hypothetical protein
MAKDKKQPDQQPPDDPSRGVEGDERNEYLPAPEVQHSEADEPEPGQRPPEQPKPPKP